ncbi:TerD family protein [Nocardia sp. NPDC050406]|uniref:TerD family protein n=1 Tax=Nocardia sp. NPDC050406 TaxID=3364318 RepID=UPI00378A3DA4
MSELSASNMVRVPCRYRAVSTGSRHHALDQTDRSCLSAWRVGGTWHSSTLMKLTKGGHAPVPTSLLTVVLSWQSDHEVDAHALLLGADGQVRSDRDFVFFNAPRHISQAVTLDQEPAPGTARLSVSLPRTESEIARIVVTGSVEGASFTDIPGLILTVFDHNRPVAWFEIADSDAVAAMMFGEFYRRDGQWRFRAVAQGWASGLAGIVTEFGVAVDDPGEEREPGAGARRGGQAVGRRGAGDRREMGGVDQLDTDEPDVNEAGEGGDDQVWRRATRSGLEEPDAERAGTARRGRTSGAREDEPGPPQSGRASGPSESATGADRRRRASGPSEGATGADRRGADDEEGRGGARGGASGSAPWERRARRGFSLERESREVPAPVPAPPDAERANWHVDPEDSSQLRWWDGQAWSDARRPVPSADARHCPRCGRARRWRLFGRPTRCRECAEEIDEYLIGWVGRAERVLRTVGASGDDWEGVWTALRYQRIERGRGLERLRAIGHDHVERLVAFAFADGTIEQAEMDAFDVAVNELELSGPLIEDLRRRMHRGRTLSRLRSGELPVIRAVGLHLDPEEKVHLDVAAIHIRQLARGPKLTEGRLIGSNKKLRFVGVDTGIEMPWGRVVSVTSERGRVALAATSARGGAVFDVADPDYTAALLEGALRVAKRLALTPGQRDTRSIPQEVKAEVWQRDGGKCVECGDSHYLEFDHIIPLSRGGATSAANLQILCRACNRVKGARI